MLKKSIFLSCILLTTGLFSFTPKEPTRALRTVIIDPGHGGADQGAKGLHATEAQLALQMAMKLGKQIEKEMPGIRVLYTRTTDIFPGNSPTKRDGDRYRASFANQSSADLFISIHLNS